MCFAGDCSIFDAIRNYVQAVRGSECHKNLQQRLKCALAKQYRSDLGQVDHQVQEQTLVPLPDNIANQGAPAIRCNVNVVMQVKIQWMPG